MLIGRFFSGSFKSATIHCCFRGPYALKTQNTSRHDILADAFMDLPNRIVSYGTRTPQRRYLKRASEVGIISAQITSRTPTATTTTLTKMVRFSLTRSMNATNLSEEEISLPMKINAKLPVTRHNQRLSFDSSSDGSHEEPTSISRIERRKQQVAKKMSKTRRSLLRASNWTYEQQWRKERKTTSFEPIIVSVVDFVEDDACDCECCPCVHMR